MPLKMARAICTGHTRTSAHAKWYHSRRKQSTRRNFWWKIVHTVNFLCVCVALAWAPTIPPVLGTRSHINFICDIFFCFFFYSFSSIKSESSHIVEVEAAVVVMVEVASAAFACSLMGYALLVLLSFYVSSSRMYNTLFSFDRQTTITCALRVLCTFDLWQSHQESRHTHAPWSNKPFIHWFRFYVFRAFQRHLNAHCTRLVRWRGSTRGSTWKFIFRRKYTSMSRVLYLQQCVDFISSCQVWRQWENITATAGGSEDEANVQVVNLAFRQGGWQH